MRLSPVLILKKFWWVMMAGFFSVAIPVIQHPLTMGVMIIFFVVGREIQSLEDPEPIEYYTMYDYLVDNS